MPDKSIPDVPYENADPFAKYFISGEPGVSDRAYAWQTAIGLQDVDQLEPSEYLLKAAKDNIEGAITIEEAKRLIDTYYEESVRHLPDRTEEADKVAVRIAEIIAENSFVFSPAQYISIHGRLFKGIYPHAGRIRDYNISKKEWVLNGASVMYGGALDLRETLNYDFQMEKEFNYSGLSMSEIITHLAKFIAGVWQIHIFGEGNTRTTAVFFIKYLRSLGFNVTNGIFAKNAWYFRNALVRANYNDLAHGIRLTTSYLELFLRNLLMGEDNELKNRYLHIEWPETTHSGEKQHIKQHIEQHFEPDVVTLHIPESAAISEKTRRNIELLYHEFGMEKIFSRSDVVAVLHITERPASILLKKMYELKLTEQIVGAGKGKYRFAFRKENGEAF